jgi:hypothetical protein
MGRFAAQVLPHGHADYLVRLPACLVSTGLIVLTTTFRWASTVSLGLAAFALGVYLLRWQRKYQDMDAREWDHFLYVGKIAGFGWFFHFGEYCVAFAFKCNLLISAQSPS